MSVEQIDPCDRPLRHYHCQWYKTLQESNVQAVIHTFLNYFTAHRSIVGTRNERIGSIVEEVRTTSVVERVALVTFYWFCLVGTTLNSKRCDKRNKDTVQRPRETFNNLQHVNKHYRSASLHFLDWTLPSFFSWRQRNAMLKPEPTLHRNVTQCWSQNLHFNGDGHAHVHLCMTT